MAIDFTTTEVWTVHGLVTMFVLDVMELKTRCIEIVGLTANPDSAWVQQMARNLTDSQDGFLKDSTHILVDRDTKFLPLRKFLETSTDNEPVVLPPRSSNCKAHLERMIFFGEGSLRDTLKEYAEHYCDEPY